MKKLIIGSFSLLFASVMTAPVVRAETQTMTETGTTNKPPATQLEKIQQQTNRRYNQTDSQVEQQGTGMETEQQPSTEIEKIQQQTETEGTGTEGTYSTPSGQSGTGMGNEQQAPTQTEQLQEQTDTEGTGY